MRHVARGLVRHVVLLSIVLVFGAPSLAAAQNVIKIGLFSTMTGQASDMGSRIMDGMRMAVDEYNAAGVIVRGQTYKLQPIQYDDEGKVEVALSVVERALTVDKIDIAVGFFYSGIFQRIKDEFQKHGVPTIDAGAASVQIYQDIAKKRLTYIFQMSPTTDDIGNAMYSTIRDVIKAKRVALINENSDAGRDFSRMARTWFKANTADSAIVYDEFITPGQTEFSAELAKIKASGAQVLVTYVLGASAASFMTQWYEMRVPVLPVHTGGTVDADSFIEKHKAQMEGVVVNNRWWPGPFTKRTLPMLEAYKKRYGRDAIFFDVQGYDAVLIAVEAIKAAGTLDKARVRDAIANGTFEAVWGTKKFTSLEQGQRVPTEMVVVQIRNGKKYPVWPEAVAKGAGGGFLPITKWGWDK